MLPTDPVSVEAVIEGLLKLGHCFHRHGVGGEREQTGSSGSCLAVNRSPADAGSAEAALRDWQRR